uniref:Uncharacterized protein n=1 Tax=Populus alba TaxID=43335 RepID=A0A4U5Q6X3_POPAL|nr:hypothetical protein D5086_0000127500 [Populus alba]
MNAIPSSPAANIIPDIGRSSPPPIPVVEDVPFDSSSDHDHTLAPQQPPVIDSAPYDDTSMNATPPSPAANIIPDTGSPSLISSSLNSNSPLHFEQVQPAPHPMVTRAQHGIHKPNPRYALVLERGDIPDEPQWSDKAVDQDVIVFPEIEES